jgi:hypothetical protein
MKLTLTNAAFLSTLLMLSLAARPTHIGAAPPNPSFPNIIGSWFGSFASSAGETGVASLDVSDQDARRFAGTFIFWPPNPIVPPNPCFVLGTVSHSGETSLIGANDEFFLHAHGHVAGGIMDLEYMRLFADGTFETGTASISVETGGGT